MLLLVFMSLLFLSLHSTVLVWANFKPTPFPAVGITSNGEVTPSSSLISRSGNVYTFTGNWTTCVLKVECSNIVIDGAGFFIVGNRVGQGIGLYDVRRVSVLNVNVLDTNRGIYLEHCSDTTISGCSVTGGNNGIYLNASINNKLSDNQLISAYSGITLDHSGSNVLRNNTIENSHQYGYGLDFMVTGTNIIDYTNDIDVSNTVNGASIIYWVNRQNEVAPPEASYVALINCKGVTVQNLHISKSQGILVAWTTNSSITHNYLDINHIGIQVLYSSDIIIRENEIWHNNGFEEGGDGINIFYSQFVTVANNKLTSNHNGGITCNNSSRNQLIGNSIGLNQYNGINLVDHSDYNLITLNHFFNHSTMSRGAIFIENSKNNTVLANNFTNNGCWAIQLKGSQGNNTFYGNNFQNNSYRNTRFMPGALQVSTPGTANGNSWDNGSLGNYWSDYAGLDANSDGIGDSPYHINPNNQDNHPLMSPVEASKISIASNLPSSMLLTSEFSTQQLPLIAVAVSALVAAVAAVSVRGYRKKLHAKGAA